MYIVNPRKCITINLKCENDIEFEKQVTEIQSFFKSYDVEPNIIEYYTVCDNDSKKIYSVIISEKVGEMNV